MWNLCGQQVDNYKRPTHKRPVVDKPQDVHIVIHTERTGLTFDQ